MNPEETLLKEADRCVKCGICLPHCPTYTLTRDEGDSPRGRISLIQGIAGGHLDSAQANRHLDRCLSCLACQAACPSGVDYSQLIDGIRARRHKSRGERLAHHLITHLPYRSWSRLGLWLYRHTGIRPLLRTLGGRRFRRLDGLLPEHARVGSWRSSYPATTSRQGRVGLFTGCAGRISDRRALDAAIAVLTRLGFAVVVPDDQGCCGAMHQHTGEPQTAETMATINHKAFADKELDAVLYLASGCGTQLTELPLPAPVYEISQFLNRCHWPDDMRLNPVDGAVGLHSPCTLRHQLKLADEPEKLLLRIPGIRLIRLDQIQCCGAAGSYLLEQPEMSDALGARAIQQLPGQELQFLATSNSGCALQLARGLRQAGRKIRTVHPVELVEISLRERGSDQA
ncbi:(Fe-S)-binding protein [Sedimenticola hydrogenitrophicus]|uniref:(Fe-S)-binding protein n=1 Tax=Sedimenticola hydrogenitrophicus TaxID=2967975 RepID=UPI0021A2640F